jgi:hypothetical protein
LEIRGIHRIGIGGRGLKEGREGIHGEDRMLMFCPLEMAQQAHFFYYLLILQNSFSKP